MSIIFHREEGFQAMAHTHDSKNKIQPVYTHSWFGQNGKGGGGCEDLVHLRVLCCWISLMVLFIFLLNVQVGEGVWASQKNLNCLPISSCWRLPVLAHTNWLALQYCNVLFCNVLYCMDAVVSLNEGHIQARTAI